MCVCVDVCVCVCVDVCVYMGGEKGNVCMEEVGEMCVEVKMCMMEWGDVCMEGDGRHVRREMCVEGGVVRCVHGSCVERLY